MSIAAQVAKVSSNIETATKVGEFCTVARLLMLTRGDKLQAAEMAEARRFSSRVADVLRKSAVAPASLTTASSLAEYTGTTAAFLDSLRSVGAFDAMLPDMKQVPPRSRVASTILNATAYVHGEAAAKPITSLQLNGHQLAETEVAAILVQSEELIKALSPESGALLRRELASAVAAATDAEFISIITADLTPLVSAGATSNQIMQDISRQQINQIDRIGWSIPRLTSRMISPIVPYAPLCRGLFFSVRLVERCRSGIKLRIARANRHGGATCAPHADADAKRIAAAQRQIKRGSSEPLPLPERGILKILRSTRPVSKRDAKEKANIFFFIPHDGRIVWPFRSCLAS
jgi:hypothetical protein